MGEIGFFKEVLNVGWESWLVWVGEREQVGRMDCF